MILSYKIISLAVDLTEIRLVKLLTDALFWMTGLSIDYREFDKP